MRHEATVHQLSRKLIRVGIPLIIVGAVLALLHVLTLGLIVWHNNDYSVLAAVLALTLFVTYIGSLITIIGGIAAGAAGVAIRAVAWGLRRY